jgi:hypothetical protein
MLIRLKTKTFIQFRIKYFISEIIKKNVSLGLVSLYIFLIIRNLRLPC